jgi:16S rRNA (guanine1516-N2)-methyltransferase
VTIQITSLAVTDATLSNRAALLAEQLNLELMLPDAEKAQLILTPNRLEIRYPQLGGPVFIDFVSGKNQHRRQFGGGRGQPLAKAVGLKNGANAFVFASLGCQVTMIEQQPLVAALLADAMQRAQTDAETAQIISRMQLHQSDATKYLASLNEAERPDVVYLDPMYPAREKSALVKKEMQLLHQLVGPDSNSAELLNIARKVALKRVTVKRPKGAEFFADQKPHVSIESKNTRYDIYTG